MGVLQQGMKGERMARKVEGRNNSFSYKKWGGAKVKDYRRITLMPTVYKVYTNLGGEVKKRDRG